MGKILTFSPLQTIKKLFNSFVGYNTENQRFQLLSDTLINVGLNTNLQLQDYTTITSGNNYSQYYREPVGVYSNVENGFGLVAGSNDKMIGFPVL